MLLFMTRIKLFGRTMSGLALAFSLLLGSIYKKSLALLRPPPTLTGIQAPAPITLLNTIWTGQRLRHEQVACHTLSPVDKDSTGLAPSSHLIARLITPWGRMEPQSHCVSQEVPMCHNLDRPQNLPARKVFIQVGACGFLCAQGFPDLRTARTSHANFQKI